MKNKKAQAAMEFLTTYGWAFMIILTSIAALAYFGVLRVPVTARCMTGSEFTCVDYQLLYTDPNAYASAILTNNMDSAINIIGGECIYPDGTVDNAFQSNVWVSKDLTGLNPSGTDPEQNEWAPGEKRRFYCRHMGADGGFSVGDDVKFLFKIKYHKAYLLGFDHTINGEIIAEVQ